MSDLVLGLLMTRITSDEVAPDRRAEDDDHLADFQEYME